MSRLDRLLTPFDISLHFTQKIQMTWVISALTLEKSVELDDGTYFMNLLPRTPLIVNDSKNK